MEQDPEGSAVGVSIGKMYFLHSSDSGLIKIVRTLLKNNGLDILYTDYTHDVLDKERQYGVQFKNQHVKGKWYRNDGELREFLYQVRKQHSETVRQMWREPGKGARR